MLRTVVCKRTTGGTQKAQRKGLMEWMVQNQNSNDDMQAIKLLEKYSA